MALNLPFTAKDPVTLEKQKVIEKFIDFPKNVYSKKLCNLIL